MIKRSFESLLRKHAWDTKFHDIAKRPPNVCVTSSKVGKQVLRFGCAGKVIDFERTGD